MEGEESLVSRVHQLRALFRETQDEPVLIPRR